MISSSSRPGSTLHVSRSEATWSDLARFGCDLAQGYYLSRPMPAPALPNWLQKTRSQRRPDSPTSPQPEALPKRVFG